MVTVPQLFIRYEGGATDNPDIVNFRSIASRNHGLNKENTSPGISIDELENNSYLGKGYIDFSMIRSEPQKVVIDGLMEFTASNYLNILPESIISNKSDRDGTAHPRRLSLVKKAIEERLKLYHEVIYAYRSNKPLSIKSEFQVFSFGTVNNVKFSEYKNALAFKTPMELVPLGDVYISKDDYENIVLLYKTYNISNNSIQPSCDFEKLKVFVASLSKSFSNLHTGFVINNCFEMPVSTNVRHNGTIVKYRIRNESMTFLTELLSNLGITRSSLGRSRQVVVDEETWSGVKFPLKTWRNLILIKSRSLSCSIECELSTKPNTR
jgi:hypothetical protein